jgi:hypothetical protein
VTFPLNLYSIKSILPHLSLICQNKCFDRGLHIFWFFFLFFYPLKLVTGFANVTSFKLKIMTLFSTSTISLNLFMEIILSLTWHIYCHSYYLFIYFIPNIHYSSKCHYFDPMCCFYYYYYYYLFLFTGVYISGSDLSDLVPIFLLLCILLEILIKLNLFFFNFILFYFFHL